MHVVDLTGGYEGRDAVEDYKTINHELEAYAPELAERPQVVVANKCDVPGTSEALERLRQCAAADGHAFFAVSAVTGAGIDSLEAACAEMVSKLRAERELDEEPLRNDVWEQRRIRRDNAISISNLGGGVWRVSGAAIERMVIKTDWENEEAVAYLQHRFDRLGLDKALAKAGCVTGDTVRILGYDLDYAGDDDVDEFAELQEDEPVITVGEIALADEEQDAQAPFGEVAQDESVGEEDDMGRLIVFKVGSSTLMGPDGELDVAFVRSMCEQICELKRRGDRVVLVSSGAAAVGRSLLGFTERPSDIPNASGVRGRGPDDAHRALRGGSRPGRRALRPGAAHEGDVVDRTGYLNTSNTFERLLDLGVLPIVNENNTVSSSREFSFGDNDMLGASFLRSSMPTAT